MTAEHDTDARREFLSQQLDAAMRACEQLDDPALARHTGRTLLAVVGCATDALLRDGGVALQAAPDKFGAFFDKAAAGYVQAIDGLHKRAGLMDAAAGNQLAQAQPRATHPLAPSLAAWRSAARE